MPDGAAFDSCDFTRATKVGETSLQTGSRDASVRETGQPKCFGSSVLKRVSSIVLICFSVMQRSSSDFVKLTFVVVR